MMRNMKILILIVTIINTTRGLPSNGISEKSPTFIKPLILPASFMHSTLSPELLNILKCSKSNSISPNPSEKATDSFPNPSELSPTVSQFSTSSDLVSQLLPRSTLPSNSNSFEPNSLDTPPISSATSDSIPLSSPVSDQSSSFDQMLNLNKNVEPSISPQENVQNSQITSFPSPPIIETSTEAQTNNPLPFPAPNPTSLPTPSPAPFPGSTLLPIQPLSLTPKCNQEILKLFSNLPISPPQEFNKNPVITSSSLSASETPPLLSLSQFTQPPNTNSPQLPTQTESPLNLLLNYVLNSSLPINQLDSLIKNVNLALNSNSNSNSPTTIEDQSSTTESPLNLALTKYLSTLTCNKP